MGNKTNTSRAFYSAYRIGNIAVQDAINKRIDKKRRSGAASEKQIEYIEALQDFCAKHGRNDYPKDSKYKDSNARASQLIKMLHNFITVSGLRKAWNNTRSGTDG